MAELCRECFIRVWHPSQEDIDNIVMSDDNEFCEGCMKCGPYVHHIGKLLTCEEYDEQCKSSLGSLFGEMVE